MSQLSTSTPSLAASSPPPSSSGSPERSPSLPPLRSAPPDPPANFWTCPKTGIIVPKQLAGNLKWRAKLRDEADKSEGFQEQLWLACRESPLFWINAFVWTYRLKQVNDVGEEVPVKQSHWPLITWPVQDEFVLLLDECIEKGEDAVVEKSRDMGATWLGLCVLLHRWHFKPNQSFLCMSRKEDLVDKRGDMDSLFEKLRYVLRWEPVWLRPQTRDHYMQLDNLKTGSSVTGESTNVHAGQGARKTAAFLDEWARVPNADEIALALADSTACRIYNSTPAGPSTHFHRVITERKAKSLRMPWWRHPEKAKGAHQILDENSRVRWTSPWYEAECLRRSKKDIAQNLDMDHGQAGDLFFDPNEIERHRLDHAREPKQRGKLVFLDALPEDTQRRFIQEANLDAIAYIPDRARGGWRFWCEFGPDGRPPQEWTYAAGIDIGNGSGNSNSIISIAAKETGQIVAKYWSAFDSPEQLAVIAMLAGVWFGGAFSPMFLCWENNGPGGIFGRKVVNWRYLHYYIQKLDNVVREVRTQRFGWHSNRERKEVLLGQYREGLATDKLVQPCAESLSEALDYIYDESGTLIPAKLREETDGGRELHGDHVVADALAYFALTQLPRSRQQAARAPAGTFAARREERLRRKKLDDPYG